MLTFERFLFIFGIISIDVDSHLISGFTSFSKELTFFDKRITLSSSLNIVTKNDSFVYATCDSHDKTFQELKCNLTIETPAFDNATYTDTCTVHLLSNNRNYEVLTKFKFHHFGEDKLLLSWLVKDSDFRTKVAIVRILHWSNCNFHDISVPADSINSIITYDNTFDVVINNRTICPLDNCRITYDSEGKKISSLTPLTGKILIKNVETIVPIVSRSLAKHFFLLVKNDKNTGHFEVLFVGHENDVVEVMNASYVGDVKMSNTFDYLTVCWKTFQQRERTNVTCQQFDSTRKPKLKVSIGFFEKSDFVFDRWMYPYNLADGGLLLVTGPVTGKNDQKFESFSVIKIQPDGYRERSLVIEGLDFKCTSIQQFFVSVTENDENEICFHFICDCGYFDKEGFRYTLKFSTKCLAKKYVSISRSRQLKLN